MDKVRLSRADLFVAAHSFRDLGGSYKIMEKSDLMDSCLPSSPKKMYDCQRVGMTAIVSEPHVYLDYPPGTGKTRIGIEAVRHLIRAKKVRSVLVVTINSASALGWKDQLEEYSPELECSVLSANSRENRRKEVLDFSGQVMVVTYSSLLSIMCKASSDKRGRQIDEDAARGFSGLFDMVLFDEAREIGNPDTLRFRLCCILADKKVRRVAMSATPFSKDPTPLWSQSFVLDGGRTMGSNFFAFRNVFYRRINVRWGNGIDYKYNSTFNKHLKTLFSNLCVKYDLAECEIDMPEVVSTNLLVEQSKEYEKYGELMDEGRRAIFNSGFSDLSAIENWYLVQRRLASSFIREVEVLDNLKPVVHDIDFPTNPKLDVLMPIVEDCVRNGKMILYVNFIHSGDVVCKALDKLGITYAKMYGDSNKNEEYLKFKNNPQTRVLVTHPRSGGVSLNLQFANYMAFYELPESPDLYYQAVHRAIRIGGKSHVFIWHTLVENSIEVEIMRYLQEGKNLWKEILDHPEKLVGLLS